jgi:gluconolactonase
MRKRGNIALLLQTLIAVPEAPSNCCFGGADGQTLFITARTGLYAVKMRVRGEN